MMPVRLPVMIVTLALFGLVTRVANIDQLLPATSTPAARYAITATTAPTSTREPVQTAAPKATAKSTPIPGTKYVLNRNTKKFHTPSCTSVSQIKDSNRVDYFGTYDEVINMGYSPCKKCYPK